MKAQKIYAKALNCYNSGNIDKAALLCDKSMEMNMHSPSINLRGLIYYLHGDLDNAQRTWRSNAALNDDVVSKKYIEDTKSDRKMLDMFNTAVSCYNDIKIAKALELLILCSKSDFNFIGVNNYLAACYIKTGEYDKALLHIKNVFEYDKNNEFAKKNIKIIREFGGTGSNKNFEKALICGIVLFAVIFGICFYKKIAGNINIANIKNTAVSKDKTKVAVPKKVQQVKAKPEPKPAITFPYSDIKKHIDDKNLDEVYRDVCAWKDNCSDINESVLIKSGIDLLKSDGVNVFYKRGYKSISNGDYSSGIKYLEMAYDFGSESYLYQHILYELAISTQKTGDMSKAKKYAAIINSQFPASIYNNKIIKSILSSK
jgi:tetratricopeptide (TPR) repeat protein